MKRRDFVFRTGLAAGGLMSGLRCRDIALGAIPESSAERLEIQWQQDLRTKLYSAVACNGKPLVVGDSSAVLTGFCRLASEAPPQATRFDAQHPSGKHGPVRIELRHTLENSKSGNGEDLLVAVLTLENQSDEPHTVVVGFATSVQPTPNRSKQNVHVPLATLIGHRGMGELGKPAHKEADWALGTDAFVAHYLEPQASDPTVRAPAASLLIPLVDIYHPGVAHRVSLMTGPEQARRLAATIAETDGHRGWTAQAVFTLAPKQKLKDRCFLLIHSGDASHSWDVFHRVVHQDEWPAIDWLAEAKVHYYDFLSAADPEGPREDGYDAAVPHFREFHVGLATQHGYYPGYGDYIHPDCHRWLAMPKAKQGPVEMSLDKIKARIRATRQAGARAGIYMHLVGLDDSSPKLAKLSDTRLVNPDGQPMEFHWQGIDVKGMAWQASMAAPAWRAHLLEQAHWIMEILQPDAIVIDETFAGLGYDEHPQRRGPLSAYSIGFFKEIRALVRSFGKDRAVLTSDCGMSGFALWADGEGGDHAYLSLLGDPRYRRSPTRYRAVLDNKPWLPCAWNSTQFWDEQMDLARQASAGVGLTNGWAEETGIHRLPPELRSKKLVDIATLFARTDK